MEWRNNPGGIQIRRLVLLCGVLKSNVWLMRLIWMGLWVFPVFVDDIYARLFIHSFIVEDM